MKFLRLAVIAVAATLAFPVMAQTTPSNSQELKALTQKLKADKKLMVAKNLQLTEAEGTAFWPVYDSYQADLDAINKRMSNAILTYADAYRKGPVPDALAKQLLDEYLAIDDDEVKAKRAMVGKVEKVLPQVKTARYVQIESKIRTLIRMELAEGIPLIE